MNKCFLLISVCVIIFSCKRNDNTNIGTEFSYKSFDEEILLKGEIDTSYQLFNPKRIKVCNDLVIIRDEYNGCLLALADTVGNINSRFLCKGRGPGELLSVFDVDIFNNKLLAFDNKSDQFHIYDIASIHDLSIKPSVQGKIDDELCYSLKFVNDSLLLGTSLSPFRLTLYNMKGEIVQKIGNFDVLKSKEEDPFFLSQIYPCRFVYNNERNTVFVFNELTDVIEIYMDMKLKKIFHGPLGFNPAYKKIEKGDFKALARIRKKTKEAFMCVRANKDVVFALFSGERLKHDKFHYSQILSFDWEGKPLKVYNLDIPIFDFEVTENKIYGLNKEKDPFIVKYCI